MEAVGEADAGDGGSGGPAQGDIVELMGLVARADLNSTFAVVIAPESPEEEEQLKASGRVKVTSFPNPLSLKPEKLRVLSKAELAAIDWSFMDGEFPGIGKKPTIHGMIQHPTFFIGDLYEHADFAKQMWALVSKGRDMASLRYIGDPERRTVLNSTTAHTLYFLSLDRISHNLIVETRAGMARVHQCYVQSSADENGDSFGYTAREWATGKPDDPECPVSEGVLAARARWGAASAPLDRAGLVELLNHLSKLEDLCESVAKEMAMELSRPVRELESKFRQDRMSAKPGQTVPPPKDGVFEWTRMLLDRPKCSLNLTFGEEADHPVILKNNSCCPGEPFEFIIPGSLASPFIQLYKDLVGFAPQADVLISLLHHVYCTKADDGLEPLPGMSAKGWGLRALTIPH